MGEAYRKTVHDTDWHRDLYRNCKDTADMTLGLRWSNGSPVETYHCQLITPDRPQLFLFLRSEEVLKTCPKPSRSESKKFKRAVPAVASKASARTVSKTVFN